MKKEKKQTNCLLCIKKSSFFRAICCARGRKEGHVISRPAVIVLTLLKNGDEALIPEEQQPHGSIIYFACAIQPEIRKGNTACAFLKGSPCSAGSAHDHSFITVSLKLDYSGE